MSKKTKRLEKENLNLTRKQESTNRSILEMAEQHTKDQKEINLLRKKNDRLQALCRGMQAQGRGQVNGNEAEIDEEEGTDSEYDYDEEDEEGSGEYDEDTEEDPVDDVQPRTYGPDPPPPPPPQTPNGAPEHHNKVKSQVNGTRH